MTLVGGIPVLNDLSVGALRGDDAYYVSRAIRARDILLGLNEGKYDYFIVSDEYGRTSYLQLLTILQTLFGPAPYGMRAVNAVLFVSGAYLLFRLARRGVWRNRRGARLDRGACSCRRCLSRQRRC